MDTQSENHKIALRAFHTLCTRTTAKDDYSLSSDVLKNIPIYEEQTFRAVLDDQDREVGLKNELGSTCR